MQCNGVATVVFEQFYGLRGITLSLMLAEYCQSHLCTPVCRRKIKQVNQTDSHAVYPYDKPDLLVREYVVLLIGNIAA